MKMDNQAIQHAAFTDGMDAAQWSIKTRPKTASQTSAPYPNANSSRVEVQDFVAKVSQRIDGVSPKVRQAIASRLCDDALHVSQRCKQAYRAILLGHNSNSLIQLAKNSTVMQRLEALSLYLENNFASAEYGLQKQVLVDCNVSDSPMDGPPVAGIEKYDMRSIGLCSGSTEHLVVPAQIDPIVVKMLGEARIKAGLPLGRMITRAQRDHIVANQTSPQGLIWRQFYQTDTSFDQVSRKLQDTLNDKNVQLDFMLKYKLSMPQIHFRGPLQNFNATEIASKLGFGKTGYPVFAKFAYSSGGSGVVKCRNQQDLQDFQDRYRLSHSEHVVQVQAGVFGPEISFQIYVTKSGPLVVSNTDQIIENGVEHTGNKILSDQMSQGHTTDAYKLGWALFAEGYRGFAAADAIIDKDSDELKIIEVNCRMGGNNASTSTATQAGFSRFSNRVFKFESLENLRSVLEDFGYAQGDQRGVIPQTIIELEEGVYKSELTCLDNEGGFSVMSAIETRIAHTKKA